MQYNSNRWHGPPPARSWLHHHPSRRQAAAICASFKQTVSLISLQLRTAQHHYVTLFCNSIWLTVWSLIKKNWPANTTSLTLQSEFTCPHPPVQSAPGTHNIQVPVLCSTSIGLQQETPMPFKAHKLLKYALYKLFRDIDPHRPPQDVNPQKPKWMNMPRWGSDPGCIKGKCSRISHQHYPRPAVRRHMAAPKKVALYLIIDN